jgi:hypothetical protein
MRSNILIGWVVGALATACDLEPKSLGNETETAGSDGGSGDTDGGACVEGETKMDDCNTCGCLDGQWACTEIGCDDGDTAMPGECVDGDTKQQDCNTCSCLDGLWACTEIACAADGAFDACGAGVPRDDFSIESASIVGDSLELVVAFSGGCEDHVFDGCWDGAFAESDPVQVWAFVSHEANDDACAALVGQNLSLDLSPMRVAYQQGYQTTSGEIEIHLEGWVDSISYSF